ncbi:MAG: hypothetical protein AAB766_01530, partial [Patescibacteria group bacterium]
MESFPIINTGIIAKISVPVKEHKVTNYDAEGRIRPLADEFATDLLIATNQLKTNFVEIRRLVADS